MVTNVGSIVRVSDLKRARDRASVMQSQKQIAQPMPRTVTTPQAARHCWKRRRRIAREEFGEIPIRTEDGKLLAIFQFGKAPVIAEFLRCGKRVYRRGFSCGCFVL